MKRLITTTAMTALMTLGLASDVLAQNAGRGAPPKVIELEEMVIEGKVAKPQVFYVLGRSRIDYRGVHLKRSFVDRIVTSARKNPF